MIPRFYTWLPVTWGLAMLIYGTLASVQIDMLYMQSTNLPLHDTYYAVAQFQAAFLMGLFLLVSCAATALFRWRLRLRYSKLLAVIHFITYVVGVTFIILAPLFAPQKFTVTESYEVLNAHFELLNRLAMAGASLMAIGTLCFLMWGVLALRRRDRLETPDLAF